MKKAASITSEVFNKFFKDRVMEIVDADEVNGEESLYLFNEAENYLWFNIVWGIVVDIFNLFLS